MRSSIIIFLSSLLLCFFVYPSAFLHSKTTLPDDNDTRLITYIINQVQINLVEHKPLFWASFFAPQKNTLTYSDLFLTTSLLTLPARLFTTQPIQIFNLSFILNLTLTIFTSYLFFKRLKNNLFANVICALIFNLSAYHLHYYPHQQIFSLWLFFSGLIFLYNFLKTSKVKYLYLYLVFFSLQLFESIFSAYLLFFASLIFIFKSPRTFLAKIKPTMLIFPLLWFLYLLPYYQTHLNYPEATRSIRDAAHFSLGLEEIFSKYQSWTTLIIFFVILFLATTTKEISKTARNQYLGAKGYPAKGGDTVSCEHEFWSVSWWLLLFSTIMSLGPVLKIFGKTIKIFKLPFPLPYSLFYYFFPGFQSFRTPSRFIILVLFSVCLIFNSFFSGLKLKNKSKVIIVFAFFVLLTLENNLPLAGFPVNINPPSVYAQVKLLPKNSPILELPILLWNMPGHQIESVRSLYSLEHQHSRLNGYSGFATNDWIRLVEEINYYGLSPQIVTKLKSLGVTHTIQNNHLAPL